jgi:hypothetical protein
MLHRRSRDDPGRLDGDGSHQDRRRDCPSYPTHRQRWKRLYGQAERLRRRRRAASSQSGARWPGVAAPDGYPRFGAGSERVGRRRNQTRARTATSCWRVPRLQRCPRSAGERPECPPRSRRLHWPEGDWPGGLETNPQVHARPAPVGRSSSPTSGRSLLEGARSRAGRTRRAAGAAHSLAAARQPGVLSSVTSTMSRPFRRWLMALPGAAQRSPNTTRTEQTTSAGATSAGCGDLGIVILADSLVPPRCPKGAATHRPSRDAGQPASPGGG